MLVLVISDVGVKSILIILAVYDLILILCLGIEDLLDVDNRCVIPRGVRSGFLIGSEEYYSFFGFILCFYQNLCCWWCYFSFYFFMPILIEFTVRENFYGLLVVSSVVL
ncbi:unnamed protein product [Dracunculus medinensis]|uniref:Ovule protein n=1 Tax=Dracunculus medinensis TaxID=318479 RepID=A0A0N4UR95_DRAME|nr:unnamed protein product [Dracunculus medinensis]